MRIYWYWPFAREEDIELARATPGPDDTLTVHALDRPGAPRESTTAGDRPRRPARRRTPDRGLRPLARVPHRHLRRTRRARRDAVRTGGYDVRHVAFLNQYTDIVALRASPADGRRS